MRLMKELGWMVCRLLTKVPETNRLEMHQSEFFPGRNFAYLMWCGVLVYRDDRLGRIDLKEQNHECIHLCQARAKGSWIKYYLCYLWEILRGFRLKARKYTAYYTNPFEMEAYANEHILDYCERYDASRLKKYRLRNRVEVFARRHDEWRRVLEELRRNANNG